MKIKTKILSLAFLVGLGAAGFSIAPKYNTNNLTTNEISSIKQFSVTNNGVQDIEYIVNDKGVLNVTKLVVKTRNSEAKKNPTASDKQIVQGGETPGAIAPRFVLLRNNKVVENDIFSASITDTSDWNSEYLSFKLNSPAEFTNSNIKDGAWYDLSLQTQYYWKEEGKTKLSEINDGTISFLRFRPSDQLHGGIIVLIILASIAAAVGLIFGAKKYWNYKKTL